MNKSELIEVLAKETDLTKAAAGRAIDSDGIEILEQSAMIENLG